MTLDFYNLKEEPFGFLPDSRFLYLSPTHRQALGSLLLALQAGRGFGTLVAQPGLGKTTLLFHTLHSFSDRLTTVYLFQAPRTPIDLLGAVLTDLGVHAIDHDLDRRFFQLREVLLETHRRGRRIVIVIDEAQKIDSAVFDLLCTISNLVTLGAPFFQFILCGQPVLADKLAAIGPMQSVECGAAAHLEPFSVQDTADYLEHRLRTAGYRRDAPLFTAQAVALVAHYSKGTPRNINHLCFEALSTAYRHRREQIATDMVHEAAATLGLVEETQKTVVADPLPAPAASKVDVRNTSRPLPQPRVASSTVVLAKRPEQKTPEIRRRSREKPLAATAQKLAGPVGAKRKAVRAPAAASKKAAAKPVVRPRLALPPAKAKEKLKALPLAPALARPKRAAVRRRFLTLRPWQTPASQARSMQKAVRRVVARPKPALTIAAVLLVTFTSAVFGMYQAQAVHSAGKQAIAASPLSQQERKAVPAVSSGRNVAPVPAAPVHDLRGMDLQSALRALSTKRQRQQQYQDAESAPALH